jgi:hypothetical protein
VNTCILTLFLIRQYLLLQNTRVFAFDLFLGAWGHPPALSHSRHKVIPISGSCYAIWSSALTAINPLDVPQMCSKQSLLLWTPAIRHICGYVPYCYSSRTITYRLSPLFVYRFYTGLLSSSYPIIRVSRSEFQFIARNIKSQRSFRSISSAGSIPLTITLYASAQTRISCLIHLHLLFTSLPVVHFILT